MSRNKTRNIRGERMNKYQEALRVKENPYRTTFEDIGATKVLQEAIEKANKYDDLRTPKKPIVEIDSYDDYDYSDSYERHYCPNCKNEVDEAYCPACGQKIDWSE